MVFLVFFDLETTGLHPTNEIIQIAAISGYKSYNKYVMPTGRIPNVVTGLTGITVWYGQMYCHGNPVNAVSPKTALETFLNFLETFNGGTLLIAHNCFDFDGPKLTGLMARYGLMKRFTMAVVGFSDSLPLFREFLPPQRRGGSGYTLHQLAREYLGSSAGAHDALEDVKMLENLIFLRRIGITAADVYNSRRSVGSMIQWNN